MARETFMRLNYTHDHWSLVRMLVGFGPTMQPGLWSVLQGIFDGAKILAVILWLKGLM